ncbi:hypothetical protein [Caulobacter hibisci]|uniref:Uncharacterized protein n=1 Tax=Caulobacter hibisci TaxID=2035993 RepID=A0ABS0SYC4_9CAUL|nr:hypothetical protein [Caulobacter hibisci]MBI1684434.1 hypothetical protein [Caulobacter hibisci]
MSRANFCLGRGFEPDRTFATADELARALLALLVERGHAGMPFGLRDANAARDAVHASGPCVRVTVYAPEGQAVDPGFAYLFTPFGPAARDKLAQAIAAADPDWSARVRQPAAAPGLQLAPSEPERSAA